MARAEVKAILDLLGRAKNFFTQPMQDGQWYKRSAEHDLFQEKVFILTERQLQYSDQFRTHGLSDGRLLHAVKVAVECLKRQQRAGEKLRKFLFLRWRRKALPSDLSNALNKILELVDADPQLLALTVATTDLFERSIERSPAPLPFGSDQKYVPILDSILEVQEALQNEEGPRVVNLYGEPGLGKSSLAKYLALQYEEQNTQWLESSSYETHFPDGVQYLLCGHGAKENIMKLQQELLENFGIGVRCTPRSTDSAASRLQDYDNFTGPSYHMKLRGCLAEKKMLIILDDLWEVEVMKELFVNAKGVKYLVTSQIKDIWTPAEIIEMKRPTKTEARQILANNTEGLPQKGEFPENVRAITNAIIGKLHHHPLSLATVGISIIKSRASDPNLWRMIEANMQAYLDEISIYNTRPFLYDNHYSLTVDASMMLMLKGLREEVLPLLDLIALLRGPYVLQVLLKFFYRRISQGWLQYTTHLKYLENRSVVEYWEQQSEFMMSFNDLRTRYIRETRNLEMRALAVQVLGGHNGHSESAENGDEDSLLTVIIAAMEFAEPFLDEVAANLEYRVKINNGGEIPRTMGSPSFVGIARTIRSHREFRKLYRFLNYDRQYAWKQQAHQYTKKIIIKFFCQGKVDDHSMAALLRIPETTSVACCVLRRVWYRSNSSVAFSSAHGETMQTLVDLTQNKSTKSTERAIAIEALSEVFSLENNDTIHSTAEIWKALLVLDGEPAVQIASIYFVEGLVGEIVRDSTEVSELWEILFTLLVSGKDNGVRLAAGRAIRHGLSSSYVRSRIASIPKVFRQLANILGSEVTISEIRLLAGELIFKLSRVANVSMALQECSLNGVGKGLAKVIGANWSLDSEATRRGRIFYQALLGNYEEALSTVSGILADNGLNVLDLRNRAVLKRLCGDIQGAMDDLNVALQVISETPKKQINLPGFAEVGPCCFAKSVILKHRSYLKYLMEDYEGAREDTEVAMQLERDAPLTTNPQIDYQMVEKLSFINLGELGIEELGREPTKISRNFISSVSFFYRRTNTFTHAND